MSRVEVLDPSLSEHLGRVGDAQLDAEALGACWRCGSRGHNRAFDISSQSEGFLDPSLFQKCLDDLGARCHGSVGVKGARGSRERGVLDPSL